MTWQVVFTKQAQKDAKKLTSAGLRSKAEQLLAVLAENPFQNPPPYEKLVGAISQGLTRVALTFSIGLCTKFWKISEPLRCFDSGLITSNGCFYSDYLSDCLGQPYKK